MPEKDVDNRALPVPQKAGLLDHATVDELKSHVNIIGEVAASVMVEDRHYGTIPGCGDKKVLLKPGAELLCVTFSLRPVYEIVAKTEEESFLSYTTRCSLETMGEGRLVATGIGAANSREVKYRYRSENTKKPVPKEYWDTRDSEVLGGSRFKPRKITDKKTGRSSWVIFEQVEHDNPWDFQNTLVKMSGKRALIAAVLNAVAASDYFTQELDEAPENVATGETATEEGPPSELFDLLCMGIAEASSMEDLKTVSRDFLKAKGDKKISTEEATDLSGRYEARRKELDTR